MNLLREFDMGDDQYAHLDEGDMATSALNLEPESEDGEQTMSLLRKFDGEGDQYAHLGEAELDIEADDEDLEQEPDTTPAFSQADEPVTSVVSAAAQPGQQPGQRMVSITSEAALSQVAVGLMVLPFYMAARMKTLTEEKLMRWRENRVLGAMLEVRQHTEMLDRLLDAHQASSAGDNDDKSDTTRLDKIMRTVDRIGAASYRSIAYCGRTGDMDELKQFKGKISDMLKKRAGVLEGVEHRGIPMSDYLGKQADAIVIRIDAMLRALALSVTNRRAENS